MIIAFLSAWAGDNEPLLLPFNMRNAYWCWEPHGVQKPLDHRYHLENNKDKGTPFFFNLAKWASMVPSLSRLSQLRRNNFPRVSACFKVSFLWGKDRAVPETVLDFWSHFSWEAWLGSVSSPLRDSSKTCNFYILQGEWGKLKEESKKVKFFLRCGRQTAPFRNYLIPLGFSFPLVTRV